MTLPTPDQMFTAAPKKVDEPPSLVKRDQYGRPRIKQPSGGEVSYVRASSLASVMDDMTPLGDWKARMTGRGVAISPDLSAGFATIADMESSEGKKQANELARTAQDRAGSTVKRTLGTAFHALTEAYDKGEPIGHVPDSLRPLLQDYAKKMSGMEWVAFEQFVVVDELKVAGSLDRLGRAPGWAKPRVLDIKTGRVDYGQMKFAIQLAVYAHGMVYDPDTGARTSQDVDLETGVILHADPATGIVTPYEVNLAWGWEAAKMAVKVRELRAEQRKIMRPATMAPDVIKMIADATSVDALNALWAATGSTWGEKHTQFASARYAELSNPKENH